MDSKVPKNVTVDEFFKVYVPKQFQETLGNLEVSAMAGKEFTVQFNIDDKKYCLRIKDGKNLEVIPGGIDKAMLAIGISEEFWRDAVTGKAAGATDQFTDPRQAANLDRYNTLLSTKGTMNVELSQPDGKVAPLKMVFNGESSPNVTMRISLSDWIGMQKKETDGQALFMAGKMQVDGDMMFLIQLQSLI